MKVNMCNKCGTDGLMVYATIRIGIEELEDISSGINTKLLLCKNCGLVQQACLSSSELRSADPHNTMLKAAE